MAADRRLSPRSTPHRRPGRRQGHADEVRAPEGPAPRRRAAADRPRPRAAAARSGPASVVVIVGHQTELLRSHFAQTAGRSACAAGAAARDRACATAGGALPRGEDGHSAPAVRGRAAAARPHRPGAGRPPRDARRRGDGPDRDRRSAGRLRPHRPGGWRDFCDRRAQGRHASRARNRAKSTAASMPSTSSRCSALCAKSGRRTPRVSTIFPIWSEFSARSGLAVETVGLPDPREILGVNSRKELAEVSAILRDRKNDELMASGVTIVDPATTWVGARRRRRAGHGASSGRLSRRADADRIRLRDSLGRAHHRLDRRRSASSSTTSA